MKKIQIILAITTVLFFTACGGGNKDGNSKNEGSEPAAAGKSEITINIGGEEKKFEPSSSWAYHSAKSFSPSSDENTWFKTSSTTIILANIELDKERGISSIQKKQLDKPEQFRIHFGFTGEKGTDEKTPIKAGEYVTKEDDFMPNKIEFVTIYHVVDGKETAVELNDDKWKGKINISGVSGTTINGSIEITDGENTLKGTFSAEGEKSVK